MTFWQGLSTALQGHGAPECDLTLATAVVFAELIKCCAIEGSGSGGNNVAAPDAQLLAHLQDLLALDIPAATALARKAQEVDAASTSLYPYTHCIKQQSSREQKYALLAALWKIGVMSEDASLRQRIFIAKVADLIGLSWRDCLSARIQPG
jgi:uncharacterized tellurite resistance protein B-like protein